MAIGGNPEPGWYPDQVDPRMARWWDGNSWSDHVQPLDQIGAAESQAESASGPAGSADFGGGFGQPEAGTAADPYAEQAIPPAPTGAFGVPASDNPFAVNPDPATSGANPAVGGPAGFGGAEFGASDSGSGGPTPWTTGAGQATPQFGAPQGQARWGQQSQFGAPQEQAGWGQQPQFGAPQEQAGWGQQPQFGAPQEQAGWGQQSQFGAPQEQAGWGQQSQFGAASQAGQPGGFPGQVPPYANQGWNQGPQFGQQMAPGQYPGAGGFGGGNPPGQYGMPGQPMGMPPEDPNAARKKRLIILVAVGVIVLLVVIAAAFFLPKLLASGDSSSTQASGTAQPSASQNSGTSSQSSGPCQQLAVIMTNNDRPTEVSVRLQDLARNLDAQSNAAYFAALGTELQPARDQYQAACDADIRAGKEPVTYRTFFTVFNRSVADGAALGAQIAAANAVDATQAQTLTDNATQLEQATAALPANAVSNAGSGTTSTSPQSGATITADPFASTPADGGTSAQGAPGAVPPQAVPSPTVTVDPFAGGASGVSPTSPPAVTTVPPTSDQSQAASQNAADEGGLSGSKTPSK